MKTGIYIQGGVDPGAAVVTAESLDMLLRTAAEVRTPECVLLAALDVLGRITQASSINLDNCRIDGSTDQSNNPVKV